MGDWCDFDLFGNQKVSTVSTQLNWSTLSTKLTWSHYSELLSLKDINEINYYIKITEKQNLSVRELRNRIKSIIVINLKNKHILLVYVSD